MRTVLISIVFLLLPTLASAQLTAQERQFVKKLLPSIRIVDLTLRKQHQELKTLYREYHSTGKLDKQQQLWLANLAKQYSVKSFTIGNAQNRRQLLKRVDVIPKSLILAQAANESNWGRSRFARQGNNFFGQICTRPGCGIKPKHPQPNRPFEVAVYPSPLQSIRSYAHNLNTHRVYQQLRAIRYQYREQDKPINSARLATGLLNYSQLGKTYVGAIRALITKKGLRKYDH